MLELIFGLLFIVNSEPSNSPAPVSTAALIQDLDSDSYEKRYHATWKLRNRVIHDKDCWDSVRILLEGDEISFEQRRRLESIKKHFFEPIEKLKSESKHYYYYTESHAWIWFLPDHLRFQGKQDIALKFYEKARKECLADAIYENSLMPDTESRKKTNEQIEEKYNCYNQYQCMQRATELYLSQELSDFKIDRKGLDAILKQIADNENKQGKLLSKALFQYVCYYGNSSYVVLKNPPPSIEKRNKQIQSWMDNIGNEEFNIDVTLLVVRSDIPYAIKCFIKNEQPDPPPLKAEK